MKSTRIGIDEAEAAAAVLLRYIEGQPRDAALREGIAETPARFVRSFEELFAGYDEDPANHVKMFGTALHKTGQIVLLKSIEFSSTCEHHLQPFMGSAHIAYVPGTQVIGVSKLARVLDVFSRRLQIQERIGEQVADFLYTAIPECAGVAVLLEARHLCVSCRGVKKQHSIMMTSALRGVFLDQFDCRAELMSMVYGGGR